MQELDPIQQWKIKSQRLMQQSSGKINMYNSPNNNNNYPAQFVSSNNNQEKEQQELKQILYNSSSDSSQHKQCKILNFDENVQSTRDVNEKNIEFPHKESRKIQRKSTDDFQLKYDLNYQKQQNYNRNDSFDQQFDIDNHSPSRNSHALFLRKYRQILNQYKFDSAPMKYYSIKEQDHKCYSCEQPISKGLYIINNNARFCYHSGRWYCVQCMSVDKYLIHYKAMQSFDLKTYKVSFQSAHQINELLYKPILEIPFDHPLVKSVPKLYQFMIQKRTLQIMYDLICNVSLLDDFLCEYQHLVLKRNLFSLYNLYEISNDSLHQFIQKCLFLMENHFASCPKCQQTGNICMICKKSQKLYRYQIKETKICKKCQNIYHAGCFSQNDCVYCIFND